MILLIDNYDSFVHNLARYIEELGVPAEVVRNDAVTVDEAFARSPAGIVVSPGPCSPREAGISVELIRRSVGRVPVLGVCLGHQSLAAALGGDVVRASEPVHGRTSWIRHANSPLFERVSNPFLATRYHSLVIDPTTLPTALVPTAWTDDGVIMAVEHRRHPVYGVQFHPESVLTQFGHVLLANFLKQAGIEPRVTPSPEWHAAAVETPPASKPVTPVAWPGSV